ncbi:hypothetical protein QQX98_000838 [Neonectria punicea]|uniref:Uncharacterized protein n=1 Tax=Neonectria punicea TaxID=979145 RepID=A0ABR1HSF4_9HYPO
MNYLGHPHRVSKYISTLPVQFDFDKLHAIVVEGSLNDYVTYTSVEDIANVVARAVDYEGVWPVVGGISGSRVTNAELLRMGETIRGKPFTVDWLKLEDLESGILKTDAYARLDIPSIPKDQVEAFSKTAAIGILVSTGRGVWTVTDEWNQLLPDYKFTQVEELIKKLWCGGSV